MPSHRPTARGVSLLLSLIAALAAGTVAHAGKPPAKLVFPVFGPAEFSNDFGDVRGQGRHEGIDILAPRRAIAVAAEPGTVQFWTTSLRAGCMLYLYGDSGTTYVYVHLNNDVAKGNDNRGLCVAGTSYAPGLENGARVDAGQPVGFVGDSGNADGVHLHFEVHPNDGPAVNPYPFLKRADRLLFAAPPGTTFTLALSGTVVSNPAGFLKLKVALLRSWPMRLRATNLGRTLTVTVPPEAVVERWTGEPARLNSAQPGQKVIAWTQPAPATIEAERGDDGALLAARVVLAP